jgi:FkbM family methyltransferase
MRGYFVFLPVQVLPDLTIRLPLAAHRQFWQGVHKDKELFQFLDQFLPNGGTYFDIGANIGLYAATLCSKKAGNLNVVAFEPIPSTINVLRKTLSLNKVEAKIERIALSDADGELVLSAYGDGANNFWVKDANSTDIPTLAVDKTTLDCWVAEHSSLIPNAIKIDVEGHELAVLKGASKTLRAHKPALVIECHCASWDELEVSRKEFIALLDSFGYQKLCDIKGESINFLTQKSTIHLLCYP